MSDAFKGFFSKYVTTNKAHMEDQSSIFLKDCGYKLIIKWSKYVLLALTVIFLYRFGTKKVLCKCNGQLQNDKVDLKKEYYATNIEISKKYWPDA